jgi:hypothetical protein
VTQDPSVLLDGRGVNEAGYEAGNATMMAGRTLAWAQDAASSTASSAVWALWQVTNRDCVVLDRQGRVHAVYNLTTHDLGVPASYAELKALLLAAAASTP